MVIMFFIVFNILFLIYFINKTKKNETNLEKIKKDNLVFNIDEKKEIKTFDFHLKENIRKKFFFKFAKKFSYLLGICYEDLEKKIFTNYIQIYNHQNIKYDKEQNQIIVTDVHTWFDTKIYFAKSYFQISPGFLKMRDSCFIFLKINFRFKKNKKIYILEPCIKISLF